MKVIATRHILYCSSQFAPGDEVTINDPDFIELLKQHGSVKLENDNKVDFQEEVNSKPEGDEEYTEGKDTVKKEPLVSTQKTFGRKSK